MRIKKQFLNEESLKPYGFNTRYLYRTDERYVKSVRVYPATPEVDAIAAKEESTLWPVHNPFGPSYAFVECADEEEAREFIMWSENHSAYEYNHNL